MTPYGDDAGPAGGPMPGPYTVYGDPRVTEPVLIVALEGWVDAGLGASTAAEIMMTTAGAERVVAFDSDRFIDRRARRPTARIYDGVTEKLTWPTTEIRAGMDMGGKDVLFLVGPEPDFAWGQFIEAVRELVTRWKVRMVVGLGAFPAPTPHTRPVKLAATAPKASEDLVAQVGVVQGQLDVPAGVLSALELALAEDPAIPVVSLWARVPHYVSGMMFAEASAALVEGLHAISGVEFSAMELRKEADRCRRQVDELIAGNPEHVTMVRKLEEAIDASEGNALGVEEVPSGDEIAAELERFLRGDESS